jgi:hypothetical protein
MSAPTPVVRAVTYERDLHRCVSCGATAFLEFNHRRAVGMGGSKIRPLYTDGVTACSRCNGRYEAEFESAALRFGWKVRKWVAAPGLVPVWYAMERSWFRLTLDGTRVRIAHREAMAMMQEVYGSEYVDGVGLR